MTALTKPKRKFCRKCRVAKPLGCFYRDARFADGIDIHCSKCRKAKVKKWRDANLEKAREVSRKSIAKNPSKNRRRATRWHIKNRDKHLAYMAWRRKHRPREVLSARLKASFGITLDQYESLANAQGNRCAICGIPQAELRRKLSVDHDHGTGRIRSLLCNSCNSGLGHFKDNPTILTKAADYLNEHSACKNT